VWRRLHRLRLDRLGPARCHRLVPALPGRGVRPGEKGGELVGPNPVDRGKPCSTYHLLVDADGIPLAAMLSAANTHDSMLFEPLLDAPPAVRSGRPGRPGRRPDKLHADNGYDNKRCRASLRRRGVNRADRPTRRRAQTETRRHRWVVERTVPSTLRYKRLGLRYDRTEQTMNALLTLAHTCFKILARQDGLSNV
jgi:transposase